MPRKPEARREVLGRIGERLAVVAKTEIESKLVGEAHAVLHERGRHPLLELVACDPVTHWLAVLLHIGQRQLRKRSGGRAQKRERAQGRLTRLAARAAAGVMNHAA